LLDKRRRAEPMARQILEAWGGWWSVTSSEVTERIGVNKKLRIFGEGWTRK
jgi:hypothetical protein